MDPDRLSQIDTMWSMVRLAHEDQPEGVREAQEAILNRYGGAARRYLAGALRDAEAADEVFQDFALRFVRGDFRSADPERGRFRQFLKTILFRMVMDVHRHRKKIPHAQSMEPFLEPAVEGDAALEEVERDRQFTQSWREDLLARTWESLRQEEASTGKPVFQTLKLRAELPDLRSPELAERLGKQMGKTISATNVRVMLHRAREVFADLLVEEVVHSLEDPTPEKIEQELIDLRLVDYCRPALERMREKGDRPAPDASA